MYAYEIYILQSKGYPSIITAEIQLSDEAAFRSARKLPRADPLKFGEAMSAFIPRHFLPAQRLLQTARRPKSRGWGLAAARLDSYLPQ
jgi:hypothetical protein